MTRSDDTWSNWAGNVTASPREFAEPTDADEVAAVVTTAAQAGRRVKPIGAGHSFTAAAATDGVQLRLDRITGLTHIDRDRNLVTVGGGTTIADLNQLLAAEGLALENLGDIDQQTISGAISTGTHGTGAALGGMATQVRELQLVLADGNKIICSIDQHPDIFAAVRVGLGALGVITEVTLQCVPAFRLRAVEAPGLLEAVLESFDVDVAEHDHFEFYWFPHTDRTLTKRNDRVPVDHQGRALPRWRYLLDDELLSNGLFEVVNRLGRLRPSLVPRISQISARALSAREFTDTSYAVFNSPRRVRFVESEYAVPRESLIPVLRTLKAWVDDHDERIVFPVEMRVAAADGIWLSTGFERDNAYIAVHQYHRLDHRRYFAAFEAIVAEHQGRPHWGKLHSLDADRLGQLYPRFSDFLRVRDRLDPGRTFGNDYLRQVLGP